MKTGLIGLCLLAVPGAWASTISINNPTVELNMTPSLSATGFTTTDNVNGLSDGLTVNATACFGGYCPGQVPPGGGPIFQVDSPLNVRITDLSISNAGSTTRNVSGTALFSWLDLDLIGQTLQANITIDGTVSSPVGHVFHVSAISCDEEAVNCSSIDSGNVSPPFNGNAFSTTLNAGNLTIYGDTSVHLEFEFDDVPVGGTILMPGSLSLTLGAPGATTGAPEPSTMLPLLAGLFLIGIGTRRRPRKAV